MRRHARSKYLPHLCALCALAAAAGMAGAQSYPERTIRIIVPGPPGGGADILARAKPGEMTYASAGTGFSQHLAGVLFADWRTSACCMCPTRAARLE